MYVDTSRDVHRRTKGTSHEPRMNDATLIINATESVRGDTSASRDYTR